MSKQHKEPDVLPLPELPPSQQGTSTASASNYRASVGVRCTHTIDAAASTMMQLCWQGLYGTMSDLMPLLLLLRTSCS